MLMNNVKVGDAWFEVKFLSISGREFSQIYFSTIDKAIDFIKLDSKANKYVLADKPIYDAVPGINRECIYLVYDNDNDIEGEYIIIKHIYEGITLDPTYSEASSSLYKEE